MFNRNPEEFSRRFVTVHKTWITTAFRRLSRSQTGKWAQNKVSSDLSAKEVNVIIFWDAHSIFHIDYLEKVGKYSPKRKCSFIKTMQGSTHA